MLEMPWPCRSLLPLLPATLTCVDLSLACQTWQHVQACFPQKVFHWLARMAFWLAVLALIFGQVGSAAEKLHLHLGQCSGLV